MDGVFQRGRFCTGKQTPSSAVVLCSLVIGELRTRALGVDSVVWGYITGSHQCVVREGQALTHGQELQRWECGFRLGFLWSLVFISSSVKCYHEPILMYF